MSAYRGRRILLQIGMATPLVAFLAVGLAVAAYPGFNHARQYLSELGGAAAPHPEIFNLGVVVSGLGAAIAGLGFGLAMRTLGGARLPAMLTSLSFGLAGVGLGLASFYPWPDPRHLAINLGLGIQLAPLFMIWSLGRVPAMANLRRFLLAVFIAMAVLTVLTKHLIFKGLVNDFNVGWWERAFAVVLVGWTGVAAFGLEQALLDLARESRADSISNTP